jgi:hypothetical protein
MIFFLLIFRNHEALALLAMHTPSIGDSRCNVPKAIPLPAKAVTNNEAKARTAVAVPRLRRKKAQADVPAKARTIANFFLPHPEKTRFRKDPGFYVSVLFAMSRHAIKQA